MELRPAIPTPSGQGGAEGDLAVQILKALDQAPTLPLLSGQAFPASSFAELKAALDKLASREMVRFDTIDKEVAVLESEGEYIVANGSHEARVFNTLLAAGETGLTVQELEKAIGDKTTAKLGQGRAFKDKWIAKTTGGCSAIRASPRTSPPKTAANLDTSLRWKAQGYCRIASQPSFPYETLANLCSLCRSSGTRYKTQPRSSCRLLRKPAHTPTRSSSQS